MLSIPLDTVLVLDRENKENIWENISVNLSASQLSARLQTFVRIAPVFCPDHYSLELGKAQQADMVSVSLWPAGSWMPHTSVEGRERLIAVFFFFSFTQTMSKMEVNYNGYVQYFFFHTWLISTIINPNCRPSDYRGNGKGRDSLIRLCGYYTYYLLLAKTNTDHRPIRCSRLA